MLKAIVSTILWEHPLTWLSWKPSSHKLQREEVLVICRPRNAITKAMKSKHTSDVYIHIAKQSLTVCLDIFMSFHILSHTSLHDFIRMLRILLWLIYIYIYGDTAMRLESIKYGKLYSMTCAHQFWKELLTVTILLSQYYWIIANPSKFTYDCW